MINFNYMMVHALCQIFRIILSMSSKTGGIFSDNPPIKIYVSKIENRITFRITSRAFLEITSRTFLEITWKH